MSQLKSLNYKKLPAVEKHNAAFSLGFTLALLNAKKQEDFYFSFPPPLSLSLSLLFSVTLRNPPSFSPLSLSQRGKTKGGRGGATTIIY